MGGDRDEAHVAERVAAALVIRADREQPRVLALRPGVGLERHRREAGDLGQPSLEIGEHLLVAAGLVGGGERVQLADLGPGHRDHLGGPVELHRAGAERDHRVREREVARLQPAQVAQHLVLGVVPVEDRVAEERVLPRVGGGDRHLDLVGQLLRSEADRPTREGLEQGEDLPGQGGLVEGDPDRPVLVRAQVDPLVPSPSDDRPALLRGGAHAQRVEEGRLARVEAQPPQAQLQHAAEGVDAARDPPQALGAVVDRVHRGHDGEQHLRRADVARGLVAADVLLAGLQGQPEGGPALGVLRHAHDPPRQVALVLLLRGEERGVRPAVAHRHPEALGRAERHVRAELARRAEEGQGEQVGRHRQQGAFGVGALGEAGEVADDAVRGRVLHEHAEEALGREVDALHRAHVDVDPEGRRLRAHDRDRLRVAVLRHEEAVLAGLRHRAAQRHRLGGGRGLVEEGRVGEGQAGEVGHHRLVVEQGLETALRDLGLVGRVLGVPARVLQDVAQDRRPACGSRGSPCR